MHIVNSKQFLDLPAGTVFSVWNGFGAGMSLSIKEATLGHGHYLHSDLVDVSPYEPSGAYEECELMGQLEASSASSLPADYWCTRRDGPVEPGEQFLVIEPADVASLIVRLTKALNDSGCSQEELVRLLGEASAAHTLDEAAA